MMVRKRYAFSSNCTLNFEFWSLPVMLGSGSELQHPATHAIARVNGRYSMVYPLCQVTLANCRLMQCYEHVQGRRG